MIGGRDNGTAGPAPGDRVNQCHETQCIFGLAGVFFGILVGWIVGSQQGGTRAAASVRPRPPRPRPPASRRLRRPSTSPARRRSRRRPSAIRATPTCAWISATSISTPSGSRTPRAGTSGADDRSAGTSNASTDLGIAYYYMNQPDRALHAVRPLARHRLAPRQDAAQRRASSARSARRTWRAPPQAWQKVVEFAPDTAEGKRAKQGLDGLRNAHPNVPGGAGRGGQASRVAAGD